MDLLEAEARAGKTVIATTHDLAGGPAVRPGWRSTAAWWRTGPPRLLLDQRRAAAGRTAATCSCWDGRTVVLDDAHHHDERLAGERHYHDHGALMDLILLTAPTYGFLSARPGRGRLVGIVCAVMGAIVVRGLAFIGDAVSHAAFPGVVIAYIIGARCTSVGRRGVATALAIGWVTAAAAPLRHRIGVLFAGMFALGMRCSARSTATWADLFGYLLGNVLGIAARTWSRWPCSAAVVLVVALLCKELLYATFDPLGAAPPGCRWRGWTTCSWRSMALTIVVSIQAVGSSWSWRCW